MDTYNTLGEWCRSGHEYTAENTGWTAKGTRFCRACKAYQQKTYMERRRAREAGKA